MLVGLAMLGALLFASVALAQDYSSATAAGGSLPATGGPASPPLLGLGALMLLAGGGIVSSRIVRRSS
jgi:LPXTG-motif cell wall-anchored protein